MTGSSSAVLFFILTFCILLVEITELTSSTHATLTVQLSPKCRERLICRRDHIKKRYPPVADKVPNPMHFLLIRVINLSGVRLQLCITNHLLTRCLCHYRLLHPRLSGHTTHQSQSVTLTHSVMIKAFCTASRLY